GSSRTHKETLSRTHLHQTRHTDHCGTTPHDGCDGRLRWRWPQHSPHAADAKTCASSVIRVPCLGVFARDVDIRGGNGEYRWWRRWGSTDDEPTVRPTWSVRGGDDIRDEGEDGATDGEGVDLDDDDDDDGPGICAWRARSRTRGVSATISPSHSICSI
ncbi:hypothetical protein EDB85DRAFT_1142237, partial [Lactarius pseudohatsudake]